MFPSKKGLGDFFTFSDIPQLTNLSQLAQENTGPVVVAEGHDGSGRMFELLLAGLSPDVFIT